MRSTGEQTYFASDIAYHEDKRERGYDRVDRRLGRRPPRPREADAGRVGGARRRPGAARAADHAARQPASRAAARADVEARGRVRDARRPARRHRRRRRALVPAPALHDTTLDLDLELAREQSQENPVYYVQYAHARIAIDPAQGGRGAGGGALAPTSPRAREQLHPSARALIKRLLEFPDEIEEAAERRAPHRITAYALELAQDVLGLLPRLQGGRRRRGGRRRGLAARALRADAARDRALRSTCSGSRRRRRCRRPGAQVARDREKKLMPRSSMSVRPRSSGASARWCRAARPSRSGSRRRPP